MSHCYRELSGLSATVISNLPAGAGLGSSAAYSVCLAAGLLTLSGKIASPVCPSDPGACPNTQPCGTSPEKQQQLDERVRAAGIELRIGQERLCWRGEDMEVINRWGFEAEKIIHGTPSGIDNSMSTYGEENYL